MTDDRLADEEVVYRRFFKKDAKGNRIRTSQCKLRQDEAGISVNRASLITPHEVIAKGNPQYEYLIGRATVGDIRNLVADDGSPLQLDVVATNTGEDPSHAEIRGPEPETLPEGTPRALAKLFQRDFPVPLDE